MCLKRGKPLFKITRILHPVKAAYYILQIYLELLGYCSPALNIKERLSFEVCIFDVSSDGCHHFWSCSAPRASQKSCENDLVKTFWQIWIKSVMLCFNQNLMNIQGFTGRHGPNTGSWHTSQTGLLLLNDIAYESGRGQTDELKTTAGFAVPSWI